MPCKGNKPIIFARIRNGIMDICKEFLSFSLLFIVLYSEASTRVLLTMVDIVPKASGNSNPAILKF